MENTYNLWVEVKNSLDATIPASVPSSILTIAWRAYLRKLRTDPLVTKAITASILSGVSTLVARAFQGNGSELKSSEIIHQMTIGLAVRAPLVHFFHMLLDKKIFRSYRQTSVPVVIGKVVLDQFVFAPAMTALYYYIVGLMNDEGCQATSKKLKRQLLAVLKKAWLLWIPVNLISYGFVPLELRVLFGNIVSIFWTAYLISTVSSKKNK
jgi:peroxisomal membrane protein 2